MDEYDKKFAEMQKYIPFLEAMIERLQNVKDKSREIQLQKMQSLHGILSNSKRKNNCPHQMNDENMNFQSLKVDEVFSVIYSQIKEAVTLKIETLQRCEDVLQKLHNKVEKGNTPGLHFPNKKGESNSMQSSAVSENTNVDQSKIVTIPQKTEETTETIDIHETPASPSPPVSPDSGSQVAPIIIPTERSVDFIDDKSDSKPASPDPVETLPTKAPIIIPTERTSSTIILSPSSNFSSNKNTDDTSFSEWEMLEESEAQNARNKSWQNVVPSHHDVNNSTKLGGANWTQKINDKRSHVSSRHIPTVPVPSLGVSRRLPLVAEKSRLSGRNVDVVTLDSRPESPINAQDVKLKSPESEMLFPKHKSSSPRLKEGHGVPKTSSKPSAPLLLSPPPVSTEPPLSMEDLAELLNEEGDSKTEKKNDRSGDEAGKLKKDTCKQELTSTSNKDTKGPKPFLLTQDDIDRESERRWEEVDKHIVKLTSRKCLPISVSASPSAKVETSKSSETKGPQSSSSVHNHPSFSINVEKVTDNRNVPSSPSSKAELRYADNYERHPRHSRDNHGHDNVKDKINPNSHCRQSDDDMGNAIPVLHSGLVKPDDRSNALYQRRQPNVVPEAVPPRIETEFRVEGPDYFNRQVPNPNHWPPMHPPVNTNEFGNNQWIPPNNFVGMPNTPPQPPHPYPHPMGMHQEMWNMGAAGNTVHMDPHPINDTQLRPNQMPPNINIGIRPLMSPTARPPDICHNSRPDNIREDLPNVNVSPIQPLISPTGFPVGPQYRNFQPENRPYEPAFDRGMEYPHVRPSWEQQPGRTNDIPYRGENEVPCGIIGPDSLVGTGNSYPRPSTPCPWNRDRDRSNRGRGRDTYYNDRNRGEIRNNFNRDSRRPEWTRDNHTEWDNCNRFNRDARNISDRDPRVRIEHGAPNQNQNQSRDNNSTSARDPRLAKDKHLPAPKGKDTSYNERDPRKRQVPPPLLLSPRKTKEKPKSPPKSFDNHKRSDGEGNRHPQDKTAKDKMQSPLESLYGVIDTKAKSAQGYCLQNFKIPKIKRTEPSVSPTPSPTSEELKVSENKSSPEKQEEKVLKVDDERQHQGQSIDKDDATAEVSSSSDGQIVPENWNREDTSPDKKVDIKEGIANVETTEEADKNTLKIGEADSHGIVSPKPSEDIEKPEKPETPEKPLTEVIKAEALKSKEEVTQEWIEALIRKSFEFGEGKKFVEQAKLMQKLGAVLQTKKLKKIKKIIESESESSSSDKDNCLEPRKTQVRRKRRVIVSDSSDEECLAERLGILNTMTNKEEPKKTPCDEVANDAHSDTEKKEPLSSNIEDSKEDTKEYTATKAEDTVQEIIQDSSEDISHHLSENIAEKEELKKEETSTKDTENMEKEDTSDMNDTTPKGETVGDKDSISKTPKAKAKRRNSLEMLQEDIREMFISEGVVTATGYRMCRMQKESQNNVSASTSNQNALITKKDEPSSKCDGEATFDIEELPLVSSKQKRVSKSRNIDESGKSKIRHKKEGQRVTRQRSKRYVQSSDSEEDQPLALRTELIQNSSIVSNEEETETHNEESETTPRRSKRVMYKEIIKESRVIIEKTDISKLECSKIMFDSSSDESFGIDVSELAAAVDISLHPEKQSEPTEVDTAEKRKSDGNTAKRTSKKKSKEPVVEDKPDDVIVLTDEESIISDISLSSSVTSGKKMNVGATKMETSNEELLSNILVGLVPTKTDLEKDTRTADKGSDADVDDDMSDQLPADQNVKKTSVKRKKKKCNWQLGILSKKKRKRALTSCALKFEVDLNTSSEAEASLKLNNSSILGDSTNDGMDETSLDNTKETIEDKLDTTIKDIDHNEISKAVLNDQKLKVSPEVLNPSEESLCKSTSPRGELPDAKNVESNPCETDGITTKNVTDNKKTEYDDAVENAFRNLEVNKLIDYAWTGKDRYKCLLCFFTGKNIVHHYKLNHPGKEILISRLKVADALLAIQDAKDNNKLADVSVNSLTEDRKFNCRFCPFFTEGATKVAMEAFYEHCTTHTGEYRFQCNSCPYQAVAKSSMRTHYYKNCRLYNDTFSESITEDEIPQENCIYGYLCSTCNYVQLKEKSLHKHLELWHANDLNTSIIKINMSFDAIKEKNEESATDQLGTDLVIDMETPETSIINKVMDSCEQNDDDDNDGNGDDNDDRLNINTNDNENENQDPLKEKQEAEINSEKTSDHNNTELQREESVPVKVSDEKQKSLQTDTEIPLPTEKLSAFVCPPELEKKEVEIQLERKRKMQEIIENIGIKLQKDAFKKRLSIIDKLQDKMKTDLPVGHNQNNESNLVADSSIKNSTSLVESSGTTVFQNNATESLSLSGAVHSAEKTEIHSLAKQERLIGDKQVNNSILISAQSLNIEPISPFTPQVQKLDAKLKDPLTTIDQRKNDESEIETSDNENVRNIAPIYESDSSSEQSDSELPTDVNMLLKETSNIAASSKDPMLTTIQRLAAQLQAAKPLEICESQNSSKPKKAVRKASLFSHIPKPPNVIPIASIKKFVGKLDANYREVSSEHDDSNPPKNFIRLRRLSGDMLSMPVQNLDFQEDPLALNDESSCKASKRMETILQTDEEECSFLKIESVVSLAPRANNNDTESPIINDIRKAVETSPVKNKAVSILKKSNSPLILKRLNAVTITQPLTKNVQTMQPSTSETVKLIPVKSITSPSSSVATTQLGTNFVPIAPKSKIIQLDNKLSFPLAVNKTSVIAPVTTRTVTVTGSSTPQNLNYKIVKVLCAPTVLKPKDPQPSTMKLKSADAYNAMLKTVKLTHLYKCMARDCRYTTDVLGNYHQHYLQHMIETEKKKGTAPFDFQKCAYCYLVLNDWNKMKVHMEEKHAHCRYQCSYCFYRAIVPSYVQIHQTISHPGYHGILLGKLVKELPLKEEINRHDYIRPFVCQHECGKFFYVPEAFAAHLKTKHHSLLLLFKCHLCAATCLKVDQLITHYKVHGFFKYQCLYCLNGSENFNDMFVHLSAFHCNRIPQVLERSLPPQPVRNKDVIEQLIVRTLDENIKNLELIEVDGDVKGNKETLLPKKIAMIDKDENVVLNKLLSNLLGSVKTSNNNPDTDTFSIALADHGKIPSSENCNDISTIKISDITYDDSNMSASSTSSKQTTENISLSLPSTNTIFAFSDESLKDSLKLSEGFDCSDEFININLLDNPDFLKNADSQRNVKNTLSTCENKADDSDIEILDIQDSGSSSKKETKYLSDATKYPDSDTKEKRTSSMSKQKSGAEDQSGSCNGSKNTSTSNETNKKSADINVKPERPLTLEDIKDTGFTGSKLYKCGYEECFFGAPTPALLRAHVKECAHGGDNKNLNCAHCNKRFIKIGFLLEHLKLHGLKRFGCSLCKMRCTVGYQAMAHMKAKHKLTNSKLIPADPKNPSADGLFIVQPVNPSAERKGKKRKNAKSTEKEGDKDKLIDVEKLCFSPDEIDSLPRQAIYNREVQCAMCPYTTKVRTNIIRHLQLHAKDESVPESGPVNPVPCLDKKERMFDKMVNLASSSHQNGRMGAKAKEAPKENDDEFIPKFVPENKRYVCSVAECNYLTVDEAMLRYHLKALHSDEPYFRCPHCPQPQPGQENLNIAIDKMGVHLKMHDTRLYKCSHCNHHHYHRHVVERHLSDKHPEKRPFVKVIRELESTENNQQTVQEEVEEEVPDPDGNHWKCNICEYKCVYKAEMVTHTTTAHDEKCQFKCTLCSFKTSGKIMFEQHINSKHSTEANVDYILIYQRIKGVNKKSTDNVEQSGQEEPFDTTPLWRRDMPRIRHIRGILLEEEDTLTESSVKPGKRKSENSDVLAVKPAKIKPGKSGSLDDSKQSKEKSKRSLSEKMPVDVENLIAASSIQKKCDTDVNADKSSKEPKAIDADGNDLNDSDIGRFGPYGKPDGNMYVCTLCTLFKTKYKHDMRDHLYRELNYARWHCKECGYLSVNRNALLKHFNKHHQGGRPDHEPLLPDDDIEDWVCTLLKRQTCIMKGLSTLKRNNSGADISTSSSADVSTPTVVDDKVQSTSVTKVPQNTPNKTFKTIDLTQKHPDLQDSTVQGTEIDINAHDDDSRDEAPLVIDLKEETQSKSEKNESLSEMEEGPAIAEGEQPKSFTCKHCKLIFTRWRGFKLHLHLTHLKRLGYLCPYCDRSTNSEALMRQHIRLKHPHCPEKIIQNPAAGGPELTDDFWQKEYGIVFPKKLSKKRKRASLEGGGVDNDNCDQSETQEKCTLCGFIAMNYAGLKDHMRIHEQKNVQCKHCTFTASTQAEMWDHWEVNHPLLSFKFDDLSPPSSSSVEPKATQDEEKYNLDDYSDDIEEEYISDVRDELMYCCFYCPLRSKSLETVRHHWTVIHKDSKLSKDSAKFKGNLPFRYKELRVPVPSPPKSYKKAHSSENDSDSPYELYIQHSQNEVEIIEQSETKQEGWICQWCDEFCDSETKMKTHQNMFHSHLPLNFKRQGSNEAPKGYVCPECSFTTTYINTMKSHVSKHINIFKCKHCDRTFHTYTLVSAHTTDEHPGMEVKIESIQNYDVLVDKIMAKVKWYKSDERPADQKETVLNETSPKKHAVARKSTTKSTALAQSIPSKVKAVARKSTNPHSRYLSSGKFNEGDKPDEKLTKSKQYSYYGVPRSPLNLTKLNTYMVVGGHRMKVNCTTLSQLININPKVVLKDLKNDIKNISVLSKLKQQVLH